MRRDLSAATLAVLAGGNAVLVQLLLLEFDSGTIALNTSVWSLDWDSVTYLGAAGLGSISPITDAPGEVQGLKLQLDGGDSASVALALDDADEVQGTICTVRTAILDPSTYAILDAPIEWSGSLDTMVISEDGKTAIIGVSAESSAVDLLRGNTSTYSDADQQALYPGDLAFQYVISQSDKPIVWPSREYFFR